MNKVRAISGQQAFDFAVEPALSAAMATRTGTFTDNMKLPVHRWFRYSAGFSAQWVEGIVRSALKPGEFFFDPFAGSGTSLLAAQSMGMQSAGAESHPFVRRIAAAKTGWDVEPDVLKARARVLLSRAQDDVRPSGTASALLSKCYSETALARLEALRRAYMLNSEGDPQNELLWLAITSILRECSGVGTAQWQYVLPNKSKARVIDPFDAFTRRIEMFCADIAIRKGAVGDQIPFSEIRADDARTLQNFPDLVDRVSLVVTSPPYPNNYDYADATRLEMTFWREIDGWGDLQRVVRKNLIRSCSQHSTAEKLALPSLLESDFIAPIRDELSAVCLELSEVRMTKGGKKAYHTMVAAYFNDLAQSWYSLRKICRTDAEVCFVIGDSAPYGVYVPADKWLAELAVAAGFKSPRFEKIRDRNTKWKNRKHRVPLKEGNLWVQG